MKWIITIFSVLLLTTTLHSRDWTIKVKPDSIRLISSGGMHSPSWYMNTHGIKNMANLSFFTARGFIPPYKDDSVMVLKNPLGWPYFCIGDSCYVRTASESGDTTRLVVSGYPILIRDSIPSTFKRSFFTRRVCPRTAIGVTNSGDIIIFITTAADLRTLQRKMINVGCVHAINLDGGSSTFLYLDGIPQILPRRGRLYPNVITW